MMSLFVLFLLLPFTYSLSDWIAQWTGYSQLPLYNNENDPNNPLSGEDFEDYINNILEEFHTPGISIAVIQANNTWARGFGYSHLQPKKIKVTPRTLFFGASTTKSFTAAAAAKLVYSNDAAYADINWSTTLASLIREDFVLQDEYAMNHVTLVDALSHRTGMPRHDLSWLNGEVSLREQVRQMRHLPLHRELRVEWEYCNIMYAAVSHAVETVTGLDMGKLFREWIWEPLGMKETFYDLESALRREKKTKGETKMSRGYLWDNSSKDYAEVPWSDIPPSTGAGGIITNVLDYTHWVRQFLNSSNVGNPLNSSIINDITRARMPVPPTWHPYTTHTYGLGLDIITYRGQLLIGHQGSLVGYMAQILWLPEHDWGFVALQNSYSLATFIVQWKLIDDFLDSLGVQGQRTDMAAKARSLEKEAVERLSDGRHKAYPDAPDLAATPPALPLPAYAGTYHHPAYHNITTSLIPSAHCIRGPLSEAGAPRPLRGTPSTHSYLNMSWTFHHVSGENWWVHFRTGPGFFMTEELLKARFDVGVDGQVKALGLQAEQAVEELAWFEKIK